MKWLILIHLLLTDQVLCGAPPPPGGTAIPPGRPLASMQDPDRARSAERSLRDLRDRLQVRARLPPLSLGNVSCQDLLSAGVPDGLSPPPFPQELLGFSVAPVLAMAGCWGEARAVLLGLYDLLGVADTDELLEELGDILGEALSPTKAARAPPRRRDKRRMEAVMFNIQQLAAAEGGAGVPDGHCGGWVRVGGARLEGRPVVAAAAAAGDLGGALRLCEGLGGLCAGVSGGPGYQAVLRGGSGVLPTGPAQSECWIRRCGPGPANEPRRARRSAGRCANEREERVYQVMEWIPAVSTLYNLGTAVYYASLQCPRTAKQRAVLSAVDLGTDAIMVATGGAAGVAGFALGAGVKTGVKAGIKYLFRSMKEGGDVEVNQMRWEDGQFTTE